MHSCLVWHFPAVTIRECSSSGCHTPEASLETSLKCGMCTAQPYCGISKARAKHLIVLVII